MALPVNCKSDGSKEPSAKRIKQVRNDDSDDLKPNDDGECNANKTDSKKQILQNLKSRDKHSAGASKQSMDTPASKEKSAKSSSANTNKAAARLDAATKLASKAKTNTVYIGGLHPRVMTAHLEKMMQPYGKIERIHLCLKDGLPRGFAFCEFAEKSEAQAAMQALDGRALCGRRLLVRPAHQNTSEVDFTGSNNISSGPSSSHETTSQKNNNPEKQQQAIASRILAVKRKLQQMGPAST